MAVGYNFFKTLLLMYGLFHAGSSQPFVPIGANFCANNFPGTDNLSCVDDQDMGVGPCFVVEMLCNGANECTRGEDEGNGNFFDNIECKSVGKCVLSGASASGHYQVSSYWKLPKACDIKCEISKSTIMNIIVHHIFSAGFCNRDSVCDIMDDIRWCHLSQKERQSHWKWMGICLLALVVT